MSIDFKEYITDQIELQRNKLHEALDYDLDRDLIIEISNKLDELILIYYIIDLKG